MIFYEISEKGRNLCKQESVGWFSKALSFLFRALRQIIVIRFTGIP
jgi:hypothetical protein